jgi:hypothetical protein
MVSDPVREPRAGAVPLPHTGEVLGELKRAAGDGSGAPGERRVVAEQPRVVLADHRGARPAGSDHRGEGLEDLEEPPGHGARVRPEPVVEGHLPAAGLRWRDGRIHAGPAEHGDRRRSHLRETLIDEAGDEQRDAGRLSAHAVGGV